MTSQQVRGAVVAGNPVSPEDVIQLGVLSGVGLVGRKRHHPAAADELVARHLRLDQAVTEAGEGATARQMQSGARAAGSFEVVA